MVLPRKLQGKRPWSLVENKWFRMIIFPLCMFMTTVTYYGWQHFQFFLQDENFLVNLCPKECIADPGTCGGLVPDEVAEQATCQSQQTAWTTGYTIATSMEAGGSLAAGFMFDHVGPFGTALIGQAAHYGSWFMIVNSSKSKGAWYAGTLINGLAVNFTAFPAFTLIDLFPDYRFIMTSVVLAGQVSAVAIFPALYKTNEIVQVGFANMMYGYLLCAALPVSLMYLLALPLNRKHLALEFERKGIVREEKTKPDMNVFLKCVFTYEAFFFTVWYVIMIAQYNYYFAKLQIMAGKTVSQAEGYMMITQGFIAVLFGWFNDLARTLPMCSLLTVMQIYTFALVWIQELGLQFVSAAMAAIANAHVYTTKFCYAAEIFPSEHFGKIAGVLSFMAGAFTFVNTGLDAAKVPDRAGLGAYLLITILQVGIMGFLLYRQFVMKINYLHYGQPDPEMDPKTSQLSLTESKVDEDERYSSTSSDIDVVDYTMRPQSVPVSTLERSTVQ